MTGSSEIVDSLVEGFTRLMASKDIHIEPMEGKEMSEAMMQQLFFVFAAGCGDLDTVSTMIAAGVDLNKQVETQVKKGKTALEASIEGANPEVTRMLLKAGADVHTVSVQGKTPLSLAASIENANPEVISMLLISGAKVDEVSTYGITALSYAVACGNWQVVQILLEAGADVNARAGRRPKDSPKDSNSDSSPKYMYASPPDALSYAAKSGNIEAIKLLLEAGARINPENEEEGTNALYFAARHGHIDAVVLLLEVGSWVNVVDEFGETPLAVAADHGSIAIMRLLIAASADVNKSRGKGATPLAAASGSRKSRVEMFRLLLVKNATFGSDGAAGGRAVHSAAGNGDLEMLHLLESTGVYSDQSNLTSLWIARALRSASA